MGWDGTGELGGEKNLGLVVWGGVFPFFERGSGTTKVLLMRLPNVGETL